MAIRLRTVSGVRVALCAAETDLEPGDLYLDDADHYALTAKYAHDYQGRTVTAVYAEEWAAMETQKKRDAVEELNRWLSEQESSGQMSPSCDQSREPVSDGGARPSRSVLGGQECSDRGLATSAQAGGEILGSFGTNETKADGGE
jgi:hypothetical protein